MKKSSGPSSEQTPGTDLINGAQELGEAAETVINALPVLIKNHKRLLDYMKQEAEAGDQRMDFAFGLGIMVGDIAGAISAMNGFRADFNEFRKMFVTNVNVNKDEHLH